MPNDANIVINLNKPPDITSQEAVSRVKRLLGAKKAGHAGTLDPLATGVLLICMNEATKISRFLTDMDKEYRVRVKLGERTDTCDSQGKVIATEDVPQLGRAEIERCVSMFRGVIMQKPPMYSAIKIGGKALHRLARKGIEIERPERRIEVYDIRVLEVELPYFGLLVSCSKGTYIRTLCDDVGKSLGPGAHVVELRRTKIGFFALDHAVTIEGLGGESPAIIPDSRSFYSIDQSLSRMPEIILDESDYGLIKNGVPVRMKKDCGFRDETYLKLKDPLGNLFGIGRINDGFIRVERLLHLGPFFNQDVI